MADFPIKRSGNRKYPLNDIERGCSGVTIKYTIPYSDVAVVLTRVIELTVLSFANENAPTIKVGLVTVMSLESDLSPFLTLYVPLSSRPLPE